MAGVILQPLLIINMNTKRDYLIRRSSAAPPDAPENSYKAITATFDPHQEFDSHSYYFISSYKISL
jgi:hypothetical protein